MKTIEFYWNDLTEAKQKEILEELGNNMNWDVFPFFTFYDYDEDGEYTVYEMLSGRYLVMTDRTFKNAAAELQRRFKENKVVTVNEWYDILGLSSIGGNGDKIGWKLDGKSYIDLVDNKDKDIDALYILYYSQLPYILNKGER